MLTIVSLFSGRWHVMNGYLSGFDGLDFPKKHINVVWFSNADDALFQEMIEREAKKREKLYKSFQVILAPSMIGRALVEEGTGTVEHTDILARLYNTAFRYVTDDIVMTLEDDVIAPSHAIKRLLKVIRRKDVAYVSGLTFDRHQEGILSWEIAEAQTPIPDSGQYRREYVPFPVKQPWGVREVGVTHLGCTMLDMTIVRRLQKPIFVPRSVYSSVIFGSDLCLCMALRAVGYKVMVDFDVRTSHIDSKGNIH